MRKKYLFISYILLLSILFQGCGHSYDETIQNKQIDGLVPDAETAVKIAEAVWFAEYGDQIYKEKPFLADLQDSVWHVTGTLHAEHGGALFISIHCKDSRVLYVGHTK